MSGEAEPTEFGGLTAKGKIFEPLFEFVFRVFVPHAGSSCFVDVVDWFWFSAMSGVLAVIWLGKGDETRDPSDDTKRGWRTGLLSILAFYTLTMFRFGKGVL